MPRKPPIEFEGAFYHVITRCNQQQKIVKDPADHQKYLQILTIYKNRSHCASNGSDRKGAGVTEPIR